ncbi:MAG: T9SS type A sorting domain-containing protein [Ignavibacteria bacterium]|nr:T9SS type A sorting domain-containing protein [Ignavibacteria bacterium]
MKKTIITLLFILSQTALFSQGGWEIIYSGEYIYGPYFKDISFFNEQTGWVLTQTNVRKTTNACQSWITHNISHNSYSSMNCFQFLNKDTGWVFEDKYIVFTSNSGTVWTTIDTTASGVKGICFKDRYNGWYCGYNGLIKKTTNGGYNWVSLNSGTTNNLNSIAFADNEFGVCGGDWGTILWTTNGGINWNQFTDIYMGFFTNVKFFSNQTCIVTGTGGVIYRTTNRGTNWLQHFTNFSILNTIELNSEGSCYIFGTPFAFLKSTNYGNNWNQNTANELFSQVNSASITPANTFWCTADSGFILRSTNDGSNWNVAYREYLTKENLKSVYFIDQSTGFAAGTHGILLKTTNSGVNWGYQNFGAGKSLNTIKFVNSITGFIGGSQGYLGVVLKTTDSGNNWQQVYLDSSQIYSIHFINPNTGWCAGNFGAIIKTTNAGNSWVKTVITTTPPMSYIYVNDIFYINENTGFIGGNGMFKTINGGLNWYRVSIFTIMSLQFVGNTGFALSSTSGNFMKSTNLGENWITYAVEGSNRKDLFFINSETGWLNTSNIIRKTTNGGLNWLAQNTNSNSIPANSIFFIDENHGWVVGDYGGIMRTTNGGIGITSISSEIPRSYTLFQNYPNPFNPVTRIRFSIPAFAETTRRVVSLKIYDILGKEIAVLVNENLNPGTYEVGWNASNFSSGIYFYSLFTDNNKQTRKMVVVK